MSDICITIYRGQISLVYKNNNSIQKQQEQQEEEKETNPYDYEVHITTIVGSPAENLINCLKRGQAFSFKDRSVEGVPILEVYAEVDREFWWD